MVMKSLIYLIFLIGLYGCGPKIKIMEEPTTIFNTNIVADENCENGRD